MRLRETASDFSKVWVWSSGCVMFRPVRPWVSASVRGGGGRTLRRRHRETEGAGQMGSYLQREAGRAFPDSVHPPSWARGTRVD